MPHAAAWQLRARWYRPDLRQWLSPDPLGFIDGPNRYAYAGHNPLRFVDPSGLATQALGFARELGARTGTASRDVGLGLARYAQDHFSMDALGRVDRTRQHEADLAALNPTVAEVFLDPVASFAYGLARQRGLDAFEARQQAEGAAAFALPFELLSAARAPLAATRAFSVAGRVDDALDLTRATRVASSSVPGVGAGPARLSRLGGLGAGWALDLDALATVGASGPASVTRVRQGLRASGVSGLEQYAAQVAAIRARSAAGVPPGMVMQASAVFNPALRAQIRARVPAQLGDRGLRRSIRRGVVGEVRGNALLAAAGETVLRTQFRRGAVLRGFDSASFAGHGADATLFINEFKRVRGNVRASSFTTFGLGSGGRPVFEQAMAE